MSAINRDTRLTRRHLSVLQRAINYYYAKASYHNLFYTWLWRPPDISNWSRRAIYEAMEEARELYKDRYGDDVLVPGALIIVIDTVQCLLEWPETEESEGWIEVLEDVLDGKVSRDGKRVGKWKRGRRGINKKEQGKNSDNSEWKEGGVNRAFEDWSQRRMAEPEWKRLQMGRKSYTHLHQVKQKFRSAIRIQDNHHDEDYDPGLHPGRTADKRDNVQREHERSSEQKSLGQYMLIEKSPENLFGFQKDMGQQQGNWSVQRTGDNIFNNHVQIAKSIQNQPIQSTETLAVLKNRYSNLVHVKTNLHSSIEKDKELVAFVPKSEDNEFMEWVLASEDCITPLNAHKRLGKDFDTHKLLQTEVFSAPNNAVCDFMKWVLEGEERNESTNDSIKSLIQRLDSGDSRWNKPK